MKCSEGVFSSFSSFRFLGQLAGSSSASLSPLSFWSPRFVSLIGCFSSLPYRWSFLSWLKGCRNGCSLPLADSPAFFAGSSLSLSCGDCPLVGLTSWSSSSFRYGDHFPSNFERGSVGFSEAVLGSPKLVSGTFLSYLDLVFFGRAFSGMLHEGLSWGFCRSSSPRCAPRPA